MSVIGWHGDPCSRCPDSRRGKPVRAAIAHGMCSLCWLGATEQQRRDALFDEGVEDADALLVLLEQIALLPTVDPERRRAA